MYSISPREEIFWDKHDAEKEIARVFDICNGCRLCDNLCPSFNDLFDRIEAIDDEQTRIGKEHDNPVHTLNEADSDHVTDVCFQCKLCYPKCPYTPPHQYQLDFPRLLLRWQAIRTKERGTNKLQDIALGNADRIGDIAHAAPALMNWANTNPIMRFGMEIATGIHRDKKMPEFFSQRFEDWWRQRSATPAGSKRKIGTNGRVVLFYTCSVNDNAPLVGRACVEVLEHNDVEVIAPPQVCCGMPQLGTANYPAVTKAVDTNVELLAKYVDDGYTIVTPGPSCGFMMRQEYPHLATDASAAARVAQGTMDICEFLMSLHKQQKLKLDFLTLDEKITYQLPCHLKAQSIGFKSRDLLKLIPGVQVEMLQQCSGHDGSWSMKKEYYEISLEVGKKLFDRIEKENAPVIASDCVLAHLHISEGTGRDSKHPIEIIHAAYQL